MSHTTRRLLLPASLLLSALVAAQGNGSARPARDLERKLQMTPRKEHAAVLTRSLTWLTGGTAENDYVSVGRLANYFGFVRFRITSGHSISRGAIGQEAYDLLTPVQRTAVLDLLNSQWPVLEACRKARLRINRSLEGLLIGEPCELANAERLGAWFGESEAALGLELATGFARMARTLSPMQRDAFDTLRRRSLAGQSGRFRLSKDDKQELRERLGKSNGRRSQELWNLTSRFFTWITGTATDNDYDTAGKPSQHFGFVDLRIDSGHGVTRGGLADEIANLLTTEQATPLRELVANNRQDFEAFFAARAAINRELENGLEGRAIDPGAVRRHGKQQGLAEARMTWRQAHAFLALRDSLTLEQAQGFTKIRGRFSLHDASTEPIEGEKMALAGRRAFALCALCHAPAGGRGVGPRLNGILGRRIASQNGFAYSPAMLERGARGESWTHDQLDAFLSNPQKHTPGTFMGFTGVPSAGQRSALLAYLTTLDSATSRAHPTSQEPNRESPTRSPPRSSSRPPNFVFVLFEGTGSGWASTSVAMDDRLPNARAADGLTPSIERLAREGMRFSDFYVSAPRCTPSRATFLTGISSAKIGMTYVNQSGKEKRGRREKRGGRAQPTGPTRLLPPSSLAELPARLTTIPELLREAGYATAHFGKWHVGRTRPSQHGFDRDDGANSNQGPERGTKPNPKQAAAITDRGIAFARDQIENNRPFYLQLSHYGGGTESESRPETRQALAAQLRGMRGKAAWQTAILRDVDTDLGRLLTALDEEGLSENTYVFVSFDHGASGRGTNRPLAGGKGSVLEGGVRVPLLVRGPGVMAGACNHIRASAADLLPTIAELAGITELPRAVEGASLAPSLDDARADGIERSSDCFVIHFPHYDLGSGPASAIYRGDYKLVRRYDNSTSLLFDIRRDPGERNDLADQDRKLVTDLTERLDVYLQSINAGMPKPNPDFRRGK